MVQGRRQPAHIAGGAAPQHQQQVAAGQSLLGQPFQQSAQYLPCLTGLAGGQGQAGGAVACPLQRLHHRRAVQREHRFIGQHRSPAGRMQRQQPFANGVQQPFFYRDGVGARSINGECRHGFAAFLGDFRKTPVFWLYYSITRRRTQENRRRVFRGPCKVRGPAAGPAALRAAATGSARGFRLRRNGLRPASRGLQKP